MKVLYQKRFLKELAALPAGPRKLVERFAFEEVPEAQSPAAVPGIQRLVGYPGFFKARFGDYRVGIRLSGDELTFERVLHRREIYRKFP